MSHSNPTTNSFFEDYFEDRLAQIEPGLIRRVNFRMDRANDLDRDDAVQEVRIVLWQRFSAEPEEWAAKSLDQWRAFAHACLKYAMFNATGGRKRYRETTGSDLVEMCRTEDEITIDDAISMTHTRSRAKSNPQIRDRDIELTDLRIDLERDIERGMQRLCASQRRDMVLLIPDMLAGYTLDEITARHGWTRNRGVTLMRKMRTVFYEEVTGKQKTGYLGSHHPLTEDEKQRIRELYASGLSYRKVAAKVGRSASAVEGVCKQYPPEVVAQVRQFRAQGLSFQAISEHIGRAKSYVGWLVDAMGIDRDDDDLAAVPVGA
jgi:DNA-directed RNA polymerase specialized sigma24 family protein